MVFSYTFDMRHVISNIFSLILTQSTDMRKLYAILF